MKCDLEEESMISLVGGTLSHHPDSVQYPAQLTVRMT